MMSNLQLCINQGNSRQPIIYIFDAFIKYADKWLHELCKKNMKAIRSEDWPSMLFIESERYLISPGVPVIPFGHRLDSSLEDEGKAYVAAYMKAEDDICFLQNWFGVAINAESKELGYIHIPSSNEIAAYPANTRKYALARQADWDKAEKIIQYYLAYKLLT